MQTEVEQILAEGGEITGIVARRNGARKIWRGDYYVSGLPIERIAPLVDAKLVAADPALATLQTLANNVEWMNGIQFYLKRDAPICHGHAIHIDTEWALTSISQVQFWRSLSPERFGDREVKGVLSVDVSDWTSPGSDGRPAMACSRERGRCARPGRSSNARSTMRRRSCATKTCTPGSSIPTSSPTPSGAAF